jgi:hypothetical protein
VTPARADPDELFQPRTVASRQRHAALVVLGPALWLLALVVVDVVARDGDDLDTALLIAGVASLIALVVLLPGALLRRRRLVRR